jgi:hypothetical protein
LDHLVSRGHRAEVISLPRRNHYPRALCDNASPSLVRRLTRARFDVLLQDELLFEKAQIVTVYTFSGAETLLYNPQYQAIPDGGVA